jgi:hypothetical protein
MDDTGGLITAPCWSGWLPIDFPEEVRQRNAETFGELGGRPDAGIPLRPLDPPHVSHVEVRQLGQVFLRESALDSSIP